MSFCSKCGGKISANDKFCAECGAEQVKMIELKDNSSIEVDNESVSKSDDVITENIETASRKNILKDDQFTEKINKISLLGAGCIFLSSFLPVISFAGMVNVSIFTINKLLTVFLIFIAGYSLYEINRKQYKNLLYGCNGVLLAVLVVLGRYYVAMDKVKRDGFFDIMAAKALSLEWGIVVIALGSLSLQYAGIMYLAGEKTKDLQMGDYFLIWKNWMLEKLEIKGIVLPNWIWSGGITIIILILLSESK